MQFTGSITALITPFHDGAFDRKAFERILAYQLDHGTHGIVCCGTTAEVPTLEADEISSIVDMSVAAVKGRIPVIVGTGSNSTAKTISLTEQARKAGADAALIVAPYYNKPTQDGLYAHFKAVHDSVDLPIILYNVPSRCGVEIGLDTIYRLSELPRIIGIKDAVADMARTTEIKNNAGRDFLVFSGEDALAGACLAQGGDGCISVTSNVAPALCATMQNAWKDRNIGLFQDIQARLMPLHRVLFAETSPSPVKYAAAVLGLCRDEVRLPLVPASERIRVAVDAVLEELGDMGLGSAQSADGLSSSIRMRCAAPSRSSY